MKRLRPSARKRFKTANPGRNGALAGEEEGANVSRPPDVGPAAKLKGKAPDLHHPNTIPVLFAKESHGSLLHRVLEVRFESLDGAVSEDLLPDDFFRFLELLRLERGEVSHVKAQPRRLDERAFLVHVGAYRFSESRVEKVSCRVVPLNGLPAGFVHRRLDGFSGANLRRIATREAAIVNEAALLLLRVLDGKKEVIARE